MIPGERRRREPSRWIFSRELKESTFLEESQDERIRPYIITPLGTRVKRVLFNGNITSMNVEEDATKAVISDPVGSFYVNVFNRDFSSAQKIVLDTHAVGDLVTVVGRVSSFRTDQGTLYFNVLPEYIFPTDENARSYWTLMAQSSAERKLVAIREAGKMEKPDALSLMKLGYTEDEAECALRSIKHYPGFDLNALREAIVGSGSSLQVSQSLTNAKGLILELIKGSSDPKGCKYDDIISAMEKEGLDRGAVDEALNLLGTEGDIYEVSLKRFKAI